MSSTPQTPSAPHPTTETYFDDEIESTGRGAPQVVAVGPAASETVGRYVLLDCLGRGGMGIVYSAYDPELDRKVALKLLRRPRGAAKWRARLVREAQAMARLNHANVVTVHGVGTHEGSIYVVMELVDGVTLGQWRQRSPRTLPEILRVFERAGRGLAAAHRAGLVHRDFKPDNVMIATDGRVLVMDFGLARDQVVDRSGAEAPGDDLAIGEQALMSQEITHAGAIMGTPAYMAPEQHEGDAIDGRSDQFSFCVALYEALYGERPFAGETPAEIAAAVTRGAVRDPSPDASVPLWLRRLLLRGLRVAPEARWPSMDRLLSGLRRHSSAARTWRLVAIAGVAMVAVGTWAVARLGGQRARTCRGGEQRAETVWDETRRSELAQRFSATEAPYAEDAWREVERRLDKRTSEWVAAHRLVCEHTDASVLDLQMTCLDARLEEVAALVSVLAQADAEIIERAVEVASESAPVGSCLDITAKSGRVAPPPTAEIADAVQVIRASIAWAHALQKAGKFEAGVAVAADAAAEAERVGYRPVVAEAKLRLGWLRYDIGDVAGALTILEDGFWNAHAEGHDQVAARIGALLVFSLGVRARYDEALSWARHAESSVQRSGLGGTAEAALLNSVGSVLTDLERFAEAAELHRRALRLHEQTLGPDHPDVATTLNNLGIVYRSLRQYDEALAHLQRSHAIRLRLFGGTHPMIAANLNNLANVFGVRGDIETALDYHRSALEIRLAVFGSDHPEVARSHGNLGYFLHEAGRVEEAVEHNRLAVVAFERSLGPEHPQLAMAMQNLGSALLAIGAIEEARAVQSRSLAIREKVLEPAHSHVGHSHKSLGDVDLAVGAFDRAAAHYRKAIAIFEPAVGASSSTTVSAIRGLAEAAEGSGREAAGARIRERLAALREGAG